MVPSISPALTLVITLKQGSQTQRPMEARRSLNELRDAGGEALLSPPLRSRPDSALAAGCQAGSRVQGGQNLGFFKRIRNSDFRWDLSMY